MQKHICARQPLYFRQWMLHGGKGTRKLGDRALIMKGDSKNELHGEGRERLKAPGWCIYDYSISLQQDVGGGGYHGNQWGTNTRRTNHNIFMKRTILLIPSTLSGKMRNDNIRTRLKIQIKCWITDMGTVSTYRTNGENWIKKLEKNTKTETCSGKIERRIAVIRVSEEEGNEGSGRRGRGGGGGQQEVAVSIINLVRKKKKTR